MVCLVLATPVAKTCDAGGGALRSKRREWPGTDYWANLVRAGTLANAAVCNICITSGLPFTRHQSPRKGHRLDLPDYLSRLAERALQASVIRRAGYSRELLFVSQGDHGVNAHGAARGEVTRCERDSRKCSGDGGKRCEVVWRNAVEQASHSAAHSQRERQPH